MAVDPERVGLDNIEVPQVCDFGDNQLDYMTRGGHYRGNAVEEAADNDAPDDDDTDDDDHDHDDDHESVNSDDDIISDNLDGYSSTSSTSSEEGPPQADPNYSGVLPSKFVVFLKS